MLSVRLSSRGWLIYPGLRTADYGLLLYVVCPSQPGRIDCPVAHIDEIVWGGLGYEQPLGQRKATAANGDNKVNGIFSSGCGGETETVGGNRVWPWLTGCGCGCCRCVIQQNNQQRARVFKPSQIYFLMLFFCNFPHFTLVFHASSALWSSSQWQYLTMLLSLLLLSPRPENGRLN